MNNNESRFRTGYRLAALLVLGLLPTMSGCQILFRQIPGSGTDKTEDRPVSQFDKIDLSGFGTARIQFGSEPSLKVTCDDNLLEFIQTEVEDGTLKLEVVENIKPSNGIQFDIVVTELTSVGVSGAANVDIDSFRGPQLRLSVSGSCKLNARGTVDNLEIAVSGAASIQTAELIAKAVKVSVSGTASGDVYASDSLDASISGVGRINCLGKPGNVKEAISGTGKITVVE